VTESITHESADLALDILGIDPIGLEQRIILVNRP
jgi:hypothetical protein